MEQHLNTVLVFSDAGTWSTDAQTVTPALFNALALCVEAVKSELGPIGRWLATTAG